METIINDPVKLLARELENRVAKNPKYSLRAFARSLDMSPATLSLILSRKQEVTESSLQKIMATLELSPKQLFALKRSVLGQEETDYPSIPERQDDVYRVASSWYHMAILNLIELSGFNDNPKWIAKRLNISECVANVAFNRLKDMNLIEKKNDKWVQTDAPYRLPPEFTTSASRKLQKEFIQKALEALENSLPKQRNITSMTYAMNSENFELACEMITEFRRSFTHKLEQLSNPDEVYNLTIQLIPFTKNINKETTI